MIAKLKAPLSRLVKAKLMTTNLDKYNLTCWVYKKHLRGYSGSYWHKHHIKPKSIYPELKDDQDNIVDVPDIVHWALHEWLNEHLKASGNLAYDRLKFADVATFINNTSSYKIDFSKRNEILDFIFNGVKAFVADLNLAEAEFKSKQETLNRMIDSSFIFKGAGFVYKSDLPVPDDLKDFISETCKQRIDVRVYGFSMKSFVWNKNQSVVTLIQKITTAGFKCVRTTNDTIAGKNGYADILEYVDLHAPKMRKPNRAILCLMFFEVYNRFKKYDISEINLADDNIAKIISEIEE